MHADHKFNRASWDVLAGVHGQDAYYDSEGLISGASSLIEEEETALEEAVGAHLAGLRILHAQCHLGFDAITFARRGAYVTGVDFSGVALERAKRLARRCGVEIEWVCADVTELPDSLKYNFDMVWATMGILCWIANVHAWMRAVADALAPCGQLILIDGHPEPVAHGVEEGAAPSGQPTRRLLSIGWDYATETTTGPQVQFRHSIRAIVAAANAAGLRISRVREHTAISDHLCIRNVKCENDGRYRHRVDGQPQPVLFTLIGERSACVDVVSDQ